jgi:hypothetical protein
VVSVHGYRFRGPGFDSPSYQIFLAVVGLERGQFSLMRKNIELQERKNSDSGLETETTVVGNRRAHHATPLYPQKLALKFTDQWRSFSRSSSLADSNPGSFVVNPAAAWRT